MNDPRNNKITVLINSCDSYEDLWVPFFTLFKKYWDPEGIRIILNTESKTFSFDGLSIECVHPENKDDPYGKRMLHALSQITTPYVIPLLDDFFLRKTVDTELINEIIRWMESDKHIVYFNCDCTNTFCDYEVDKYRGFKRLPNGNEYILNMQAAVWRTQKLLHYWRPQVSPWEWEVFTNLLAARNRTDKFYCITEQDKAFCDYGYSSGGMGVFRGKWVKEDVVPLFEKEGICVDFSKRGFYDPPEEDAPLKLELRDRLKTPASDSEFLCRCLGEAETARYKRFLKQNRVVGLLRCPPDILYVHYALANERKKFIIRKSRKLRLNTLLRRGLSWRKSQ